MWHCSKLECINVRLDAINGDAQCLSTFCTQAEQVPLNTTANVVCTLQRSQQLASTVEYDWAQLLIFTVQSHTH